MTSPNGQLPEDGSTTSSSLLKGGLDEMMVIRTLRRFAVPIFVPIFRPLIRQLVEERIGLANQELMASLIQNPPNKTRAATLAPRRLKLKFKNKIALPVFTGSPLSGENRTPIEINLVDASTDQIVDTGAGSNAKLEIMGFRVGDDDNSWTFEELQERIMSERQGRRILQGNTCLQLKEGVGFVHEIHFTHDSKHTKNGSYRLGAIVVDASLIKQVEVAWTETFDVKDKRYTYYEKHPYPSLSDEVYRLQQIGHKGQRFKNLQKAGVNTVKDLLILLYKDEKRLEDILELKASSKTWCFIVKNAQASNGMFLYLDLGNERKTGVVLDAKRQLKALIIEPRLYMPVNHLSDQQKLEVQDLVKFASENLEMLDCFEDETSLKKHLQSHPGLASLPSAMVTDEPLRTTSQVAEACLKYTPFITSQSERGKEKGPFDDDQMIYSTNYHRGHISSHPPNLKSPNRLNYRSATEPGPSSQAVEPIIDTCGLTTIDNSNCTLEDWELDNLLNDVSAILYENLNNECHATASVSTITRTRWREVFKLLSRNSVKERFILSQEVQPFKKQKCC